MPCGLITDIVKFRVKENEEKMAQKNATKASAAAKAKPKKSAAETKLIKPATPKIKTVNPTDAQQIVAWLDKQKPDAKDAIEAARKIISKACPCLGEKIKWNAPSYYFKEQDIVTFGPYKTHKLLLVFYHPAVVSVNSSLLEGDYKNRRLVHFKSKAEAEKNKIALSNIIREIIKMIDNQ